MKSGDIYICNICLLKSSEDDNAVFIKAHKNGEDVHVCTSCMPSVIHGSGIVVKSNSEVESELAEELESAAN